MESTLAKTLVNAQSELKFAKSPRWIHQKLLFLDVHDRSIKSADLDGAVDIVDVLPFVPGGLGVLPDRGLIIGDAVRRKIYRWEATSPKQIADLSNVARFYLGDGIVDSRGGVYVGDVGFDFLDPLVDPVPNGIIVHVDNGGQVALVAEDLFFPSGMIITPDKHTLIVAETLGHCLTAFDIAEDGSLGNRRVWAPLPDDVNPDGICLDGEGAVWAAATKPQALRVLEGGQIVNQIIAEQPMFDVALGGPQGKHLFMCTSPSSDPIITRRRPGATIEIATVRVSGVPIFADKPTVLQSIRQ